LRYGHFIKNYCFRGIPWTLTAVDNVLRLCLIFENETDVGPNDNVVQLIKAHSFHTLFVVFENFTIYKKHFVWSRQFFCKHDSQKRKISGRSIFNFQNKKNQSIPYKIFYKMVFFKF